MEMLSFGRHQASKIEPKRVPGSSYLAVLWMAGCGQRDMGDVEGDMTVPKGSGLQIGASEPRPDREQPAEPRPWGGVGEGILPSREGLGVL